MSMVDAIILATARAFNARIITSDTLEAFPTWNSFVKPRSYSLFGMLHAANFSESIMF